MTMNNPIKAPNRLWIWSLLAGFMLWACAGSKTAEQKQEDELIDKLTVFVEAIQGDQWAKALDMTSPTEQRHLLEGQAQLSEGMKTKLRALKLSTVAHRGKVHLVKGKLEGLSAVLPQGLITPNSETPKEVPSFQ
jgi:hypothetical protein